MSKVLEHHGYVFIVAWCRMQGRKDFYTQAECDAARDAGAPKDTVFYRHHSRVWAVLDDIPSKRNRDCIENHVREHFPAEFAQIMAMQ